VTFRELLGWNEDRLMFWVRDWNYYFREPDSAFFSESPAHYAARRIVREMARSAHEGSPDALLIADVERILDRARVGEVGDPATWEPAMEAVRRLVRGTTSQD
jgi:hypothetical protein